jgi:hypothetical protein
MTAVSFTVKFLTLLSVIIVVVQRYLLPGVATPRALPLTPDLAPQIALGAMSTAVRSASVHSNVRASPRIT